MTGYKYKILSNTFSKDLESEVEQHLNNGWWRASGVAIAPYGNGQILYAQAVEKLDQVKLPIEEHQKAEIAA